MPDFDIDFCQDRRDEVIRLRAGALRPRSASAQIITFGTLQARGVLRDVGRVLEMPYGQVDKLCKLVPMNPAAPVTLARAIDEEPRLQAARDAEPVVRRAFDIAHEARRAAPPRLDACGRHRDRRPAAGRTGAALSRSEIRHAGDPVQHEMGRAGGAGEVRLPRPEDADACSTSPSKLVSRRGIELDLLAHPARRRQELRDARARRDGRHLPGGRAGHAPRADRHAARPLRGHHRAGRALSAGPDGEHPDLLRAQARPGAARIHPSEARADPARDLRRHHLSGAGDADRAASSPATSLGEADLLRRAMGKKIRRRWTRSASASSTARSSDGVEQGAGGGDLRIAARSSPTTASTRATRPPTRWSPTRPPT